jgi:hypothetical protein
LSELSYDSLITRLNKKGLQYCLEASTLFSIIEFLGGSNSLFSPLLHNENIRLFAEAAVKSKAAWYKDRQLELSDFPFLINGTSQALDDPRFFHISSGRPREEIQFDLQCHFSRVAYLQILPQQNPMLGIGQFVAVAAVIPSTEASNFPQNRENQALSFQAEVESALGASIQELLRIHLYIQEYFGQLGEEVIRSLPSSQRRSVNNSKLAEYLASFLKSFRPGRFVLVAGEIEKRFDKSWIGHLEPYFQVFARPIKDHRCLEDRPNQKGLPNLRASSLDRFPLIEGRVPNTYFVPNLRLFARSFSQVAHRALEDYSRELREKYRNIRGFALEIYLRKMVAERAPALRVIEELSWFDSRGESAGPDMLIIDHGGQGCVIAVEVKVRRMSPSSKFDLDASSFSGTDFDDTWEALKNLPGKIKHVFNFEGGYAKHKNELSRAIGYRRWCVGVVGEAPFMFGQLTSYLSRTSESFPLKDLGYPWAVMGAETFERMVEVAVQNGRSLQEAIELYHKACQTLKLSEPMAEMFNGFELDYQRTFAASQLRRAIGVDVD